MVAPKTVQTYRKRWEATGNVLPRPHGGGRSRKIDDALLRQLLEEKNDWTLDQLAVEYALRHGGERVARSTMSQAVRRLEWTRKKKTIHADEQNSPRVQRLRAQFASDIEQVSPPEPGFPR